MSLLRQLACAVAGVVNAAVAAAAVGLWAATVVLLAAGWSCAQYDDLYLRARSQR